MKKNKYLYKAAIKICLRLLDDGYIIGLILYNNDGKFDITYRQKEYMLDKRMIKTQYLSIGYRLTPEGKQMIRDYNLNQLIN